MAPLRPDPPFEPVAEAVGHRGPSAATGETPPESPLAMPTQSLGAPGTPLWTRLVTWGCRVTRLFIAAGTLAITAGLTWQMIQAVGMQAATTLQILLVGLFALNSAWIAFSAASAVAAFLAGLAPRRVDDLPPPAAMPQPSLRTVLVMPVYNEDPRHSFAALQAMAEGLVGLRAARQFEIFVLSDSTSPEAWTAEQRALHILRQSLSGRIEVFYRRRCENRGKKAGNIREFVERWGGRYDAMVVLDADSLMAPATLVGLAHAMAAEPDLGLLQTAPRLKGGTTLFARAQQFASAVYGTAIADGIRAWQGDDGNFWGHNAIIRLPAFAAACGLPELPGRKPFGGPVMSHDFVEAALLRRAGWKVRMDTRLRGSWEEPPPTLIDFVKRDRRWAQGNLQHAKVLGARGLAPVSRLHMVIGILSYLASPMWLALILVGVLLALQATFVRPEYFPHRFQLFPAWPTFDSARMMTLFAVTLGVLLAPKLLALGRLLLSDRRRDYGGGLALLAGFVLETLFSALTAPAMMLLQTRHLAEILRGRDSGWMPQNRDGGALGLDTALRFHTVHVAGGGILAAVAWNISPEFLGWLSPVVVGLCLSPLVTWAGASAAVGRGLARVALLRTPEETAPPRLFAACARDAAVLARRLEMFGTDDDRGDDARRRQAG